jgi:hypothetical protein
VSKIEQITPVVWWQTCAKVPLGLWCNENAANLHLNEDLAGSEALVPIAHPEAAAAMFGD